MEAYFFKSVKYFVKVIATINELKNEIFDNKTSGK